MKDSNSNTRSSNSRPAESRQSRTNHAFRTQRSNGCKVRNEKKRCLARHVDPLLLPTPNESVDRLASVTRGQRVNEKKMENRSVQAALISELGLRARLGSAVEACHRSQAIREIRGEERAVQGIRRRLSYALCSTSVATVSQQSGDPLARPSALRELPTPFLSLDKLASVL